MQKRGKNMKWLIGLLVLLAALLVMQKSLSSGFKFGFDYIREVIQEMVNRSEMTGKRTDRTNKKAPKVIESKEIVFFSYEFACDFFHFYEKEMDFEYCSFIVRKDQDQVIFEGSAIPLAGMKGFDFEIELPLTTLDDLQAIIDEYPVAASNGTNIFTAGLPPNIGSDLRIDYASGEGIYARDNSGAAVDNRATIAMYDFFIDLAEDHGQDLFAYKRELDEFYQAVAGYWETSDKKLAVWVISNQLYIYENGSKKPSESGIYHYDEGKILNRTIDGTLDFFSYFKVEDEVLYGFGAQGEVTEFYPSSRED